jgi:hypothetical protein
MKMSVVEQLKAQLADVERQIEQLEDMREALYARLDSEVEA